MVRIHLLPAESELSVPKAAEPHLAESQSWLLRLGVRYLTGGSDVSYILSAGRGDVKYQPISLRPNNERLHGPLPDCPARPLCARDETLAG